MVITKKDTATGPSSSSAAIRKTDNEINRNDPQNEDHSDSMAVMVRRREKRRHLHSASGPDAIMDLRDPYSVIALAIRYDEANANMNENHGGTGKNDDENENILTVPLESGPIYNSKAFVKALQELQVKTSVPSYHRVGNTNKNTRGSTVGSRSSKKSNTTIEDHTPIKAMTPIILSGLVANIQERSESEIGVSAVELVAYCRSMRRAALSRHRIRKKRRKVQKYVTPFILFFILSGLSIWYTMSVRSALLKHGFLDESEIEIEIKEGKGSCYAYQPCRLAIANVWEHIDPFNNHLLIPDCNWKVCRVISGQVEYPFYAMHALFYNDIISIEELERSYSRKKSTIAVWPLRQDSSHQQYLRTAFPLEWLGASHTNRMIQDIIQEHHPADTNTSLLDFGCGIGGLLYTMLNTVQPQKKSFCYHGIALSTPEISQAKEYLAMHELDTVEAQSLLNTEIVFEQYNFNKDPSRTKLSTYNVAVAVESLFYSSDVSNALTRLIHCVRKDGLIFVVDDFLNPWVSEDRSNALRQAMGKPSLTTYEKLQEHLSKNQFPTEPIFVSNLSLELKMVGMEKMKDVEPVITEIYNNIEHFILRSIVGPWQSAFGDASSWKSIWNTPLHMQQITESLAENKLAQLARRQAYDRSDLSYYMLVYKV